MPPDDDPHDAVVPGAYTDAMGSVRQIDPSVLDQVRELALAPRDAPDALGPLVVRRGVAAQPLPPGATIALEDGTEQASSDVDPSALPLGYHRLTDEHGTRRLIVAPATCHQPTARSWGWSTQLYAARSRSSWGMGDLGDLRRLAVWAAAHGAGFVLVNPLGAAAPIGAQQPSPYSPASRRFLNPIYLDIEAVPGADRTDEVAAASRAGRRLLQDRRIDRDAVWALKLDALERIYSDVGPDAGFRTWRTEQPEELERFATWATLCEQHGASFKDWPPELRHPDAPEVASERRVHRRRVRFHVWLQYLLAMQAERAADAVAVMHDLPIGVDPCGFDAWVDQDLLAAGVSVGVPPDELNTAGQDWGLPPYVPWKLRAADYEPFIRTVRAGLRGRGGLRIDHVMGLFRLWWIPPGHGPADGAFVRYPAEDLLAVLALESSRAEAVVVGEDLGTVEEGVRTALADHHVLSTQLLWFEDDEPEAWPVASVAAITTHDLPTVVGLWDHSDLAVQRSVGMVPNEDSTAVMRDRLRERGGLDEDASADDVVLAAHRVLAGSPSQLLVATMDDALAEPRRPNLPSAPLESNWSLAAAETLEQVETAPLPAAIASVLRSAVEGSAVERTVTDDRVSSEPSGGKDSFVVDPEGCADA